jgi:hypothetical protein
MPDLSSLFLLVFLVSFGLTLVSLVSGMSGAHVGSLRLGHAGGTHGLRLGHAAHGGAMAHGGSLRIHGHASPARFGGQTEQVSPLNMATLLGFLTWFSGVGYILTAYTGLGTVLAIASSVGAGLLGAGAIFLFLARVLLPGQTAFLDDADYQLIGTVGHLSVGIREGGTGELVYSKDGARHVLSARTEDGSPMERGSEVVVVRHERGIAFVEQFDEFMRADRAQS